MINRGTLEYEVLSLMRKKKKYRLFDLAEIYINSYGRFYPSRAISRTYHYEEARSALRRLVNKDYVVRVDKGVYMRVK